MGDGAIGVDRLTNGEAENSIHKQAVQPPPQGFIPRCQIFLSDGSNDAASDHDDEEEEESLEPRPAKRAKEDKDLTFQYIYMNQGVFDEEDEDDSDWELLQLPKIVEVVKWFCKNLVNLHEVVHCDICGEHKDSKIVSHGFFASPLAQDEDLNEV